VDIVRYLLDHGANPDNVDETGFTPLHEAAKIGNSLISTFSLCPSWSFVCIILWTLPSSTCIQVMDVVKIFIYSGMCGLHLV
jgi:ankyrin repeat protein